MHYNDVIMDAMTSHITSLTIVYSTVYTGADQRKHQSSARHWLCAGNSPVNSPHKWPVTQKMFPFMTSSWHSWASVKWWMGQTRPPFCVTQFVQPIRSTLVVMLHTSRITDIRRSIWFTYIGNSSELPVTLSINQITNIIKSFWLYRYRKICQYW